MCQLAQQPTSTVEMNLYREFPRVQWEFHENGKYYSISVETEKSTEMALPVRRQETFYPVETVTVLMYGYRIIIIIIIALFVHNKQIQRTKL